MMAEELQKDTGGWVFLMKMRIRVKYLFVCLNVVDVVFVFSAIHIQRLFHKFLSWLLACIVWDEFIYYCSTINKPG